MQRSDIRKRCKYQFLPVDVPDKFYSSDFSELNALHDFNILAIDPGKATGLCFWNHLKEELVDYTVDFPGDYIYIPDFVLWSPTVVIIERPFMSMSVNPILYEAFGFWKFHYSMFNIPIVLQNPNCKDVISKQYQLHKKEFSSIHAAEAYSHALYFLNKCKYPKVQESTFIRFNQRPIDSSFES